MGTHKTANPQDRQLEEDYRLMRKSGTQCRAQIPPSHEEKGLEHFLGCAKSAVPF